MRRALNAQRLANLFSVSAESTLRVLGTRAIHTDEEPVAESLEEMFISERPRANETTRAIETISAIETPTTTIERKQNGQPLSITLKDYARALWLFDKETSMKLLFNGRYAVSSSGI